MVGEDIFWSPRGRHAEIAVDRDCLSIKDRFLEFKTLFTIFPIKVGEPAAPNAEDDPAATSAIEAFGDKSSETTSGLTNPKETSRAVTWFGNFQTPSSPGLAEKEIGSKLMRFGSPVSLGAPAVLSQISGPRVMLCFMQRNFIQV
jgi:hypothetical protein